MLQLQSFFEKMLMQSSFFWFNFVINVGNLLSTAILMLAQFKQVLESWGTNWSMVDESSSTWSSSNSSRVLKRWYSSWLFNVKYYVNIIGTKLMQISSAYEEAKITWQPWSQSDSSGNLYYVNSLSRRAIISKYLILS